MRRQLVCGIIAGSIACGTSHGRQHTDIAAGVLFERYETVAKARVSALPFESLARPYDDQRIKLLRPFGYLFGALDTTGEKTAERAMSQTEVVLGGMKDFRAPEGLGPVSSRNCYVLIVKRGFDLARLLGKPASEQWEGVPVWRWTAKLGEFGEGDDRSSALVAIQMKPYVLVSNDPEAVFATARSLKSNTSPTVLNTLSEWRDVASREYWVYRRLRFDAADPMTAGLDGLRKDAHSLLLFYDPAQKVTTVRLTSRDPVATSPESLDHLGRVPTLQPISPTAWQAQLPAITRHTPFGDAWAIVFGRLGFAVAV